MRTMLINSSKILATAAIILLAGYAILAWNARTPTQGVQSAQADIAALGFSPKTKHERFLNTLQQQGFETPRSYDWNGNKMFFSMMRTRKTPIEIMRQLQESFVENDVNKKAHLYANEGFNPKTIAKLVDYDKRSKADQKEVLSHTKNQVEFLDDFFGGGVVPFVVQEDYTSMYGATSKGRTDSAFGFLKERYESRQKNGKRIPLHDSIRAMRAIEAFKNKGTGITTVTAVWSDEDLDMNKFNPDSTSTDVNVNPNIPSCLGCKRLMRFSGERHESRYANNVYAGQSSISDTVRFYDRSLGARGWRRSESMAPMDAMRKLGHLKADSRLISYTKRDNEFLTIMIYKDSKGRTLTQLFESP